MLHDTGVAYCMSAMLKDNTMGLPVINLLQDIHVEAEPARIHYDTACSRVLVTHAFAKRAGFRSRPADYCIQVVGGKWTDIQGCIYSFEMTDTRGKRHQVEAYGIEEIAKTHTARPVSS